MRALIMASVSRAIVIVPASTSLTNCLIRSLPRSLPDSSFAKRPSSTMLSSRLVCVVVVVACCGTACCGSAIGPSLYLGLQLAHLVFVLESLHEDLVELVVALEAAAQIREFRAQIEQFLQGLDLAGHVGRLEIIHALEVQVDADLTGIRVLAQFVFDGVGEMRFHARQDIIKIIQ